MTTNTAFITQMVLCYKFPGHNLEWVDTFHYLGVTISKNFSWSAQCEHAAARANKVRYAEMQHEGSPARR